MPIRIAVSPRAEMIKGDATWKAPSAAAPVTSVRRSSLRLKLCDVMRSPGRFFLLEALFEVFGTPAASRQRASGRVMSGRPFYRAAGVLDRSGCFFAGHRISHREHVVRIALRWMCLADKDRAHQFMVAGAERRCPGLQGDLRRQPEAGGRPRQRQ